jgi:choline-sulfatase
MAGRPDIGGPLGTAAFGALAGFLVAWLALRPPWGKPVVEPATAPVTSALPKEASSIVVTTSSARPDAATAPPAPPPAKRSYNVLLLTVDTLRHDLGFMGYPKPITPNIDALASRSVVFEQTYSTASFTPKSLGPLHIGRYPSETARDFAHYTTFYPTNVFLAERVHVSGARTFAGTCHRYFTWKTGFQQGFDIFDISATPPAMTDNDVRVTSERLTDVALGLLAKPENTGGPQRFFAWFHYFDPHAPYVTHPGVPAELAAADKSMASRERALYDGEVWFTDFHIGRLVDYVSKQPWGKDTVIILTADHGEAFGEHKHWKHGRELWEPLVRVPFVAFVPGAKPRRIKVKRSLIDLAPTVIELVGAPLPSDDSLRGTSLAADVFAAAESPLTERDVFIDMPEGPFNDMRRAIVTGPSPGMKLIDFAGKRFELYDLAKDPAESANLSSDAARMQPVVERFQKARNELREVTTAK